MAKSLDQIGAAPNSKTLMIRIMQEFPYQIPRGFKILAEQNTEQAAEAVWKVSLSNKKIIPLAIQTLDRMSVPEAVNFMAHTAIGDPSCDEMAISLLSKKADMGIEGALTAIRIVGCNCKDSFKFALKTIEKHESREALDALIFMLDIDPDGADTVMQRLKKQNDKRSVNALVIMGMDRKGRTNIAGLKGLLDLKENFNTQANMGANTRADIGANGLTMKVLDEAIDFAAEGAMHPSVLQKYHNRNDEGKSFMALRDVLARVSVARPGLQGIEKMPDDIAQGVDVTESYTAIFKKPPQVRGLLFLEK